MKRLTFLNLFFNAILALFVGSVVVHFSPGVVNPYLFALGFLAATSVTRIVMLVIYRIREGHFNLSVRLMMAVQTEVWENFIAENLFKDYPWIKRAKDRSDNVLNNAVVHIPQAGNKPNASKNRENYPIPVTKRNDTDVTYAIDEISTDATHIPEADKVELSYDKLGSVIQDHFGVLGEESARDILDRWYPSNAANIVRTTGTDTAVYLNGQTGNRNKFMVADVQAAKTKLNLNTKKESGPRALIMTEEAYNQLKSDPLAKEKETMDSVGAVWSNGDLIKLEGFDIVRTDVTGRYDNTGTPVKKDYTADDAATDNDVMLAVDFRFVHFALGQVKFFETIGSAEYQGDIYSAQVRLGGRIERNDQAGVVAIVQEP